MHYVICFQLNGIAYINDNAYFGQVGNYHLQYIVRSPIQAHELNNYVGKILIFADACLFFII